MAGTVRAQTSYRAVTISKADGVPHNVINTLFQDSRGYLWAGTLNGLARYDGYNFVTYRRKTGDTNSPSGSIITAITEDAVGNIWMGTQDDGLSRFTIKTGKWTRYTQEKGKGLGENNITALAGDSSGGVWVGTASGLLYYNPTSDSFQDIPLPTQYFSIFTLCMPDKEHVWFATGGNTLCRLDIRTRTIRQLQLPISIGFPAVTWIQPNQDGSVIVGASAEKKDNMVVIDGECQKVLRTLTDPLLMPPVQQKAATLTGLSPFFAQLDERKAYALRRRSAGVSSSPVEYALILTTATGVSGEVSLHAEPRYFLRDRNAPGVYWIGTTKGIIKITESRQKVLTFRHDPTKLASRTGLNNNYVRSFARDANANIWIGTVAGMHLLEGNTIKHIPIQGYDSISRRRMNTMRVNILYNDPQEGILVGTNFGLFRFDTQKHSLTNIYVDSVIKETPRTLLPAKIWSVLRDRNGALWVGTNNEGLFRWQPGAARAQRFRNNPADPTSLNDNRVWCMAEDSRGNLWFGTERGLARWNPATQSFTRYLNNINKPFSICGNNIWNIYEDSRGRLWFAAYGDGISRYRYESDDFESLTSVEGLPVATITGVIVSGESTMWIATDDGLIEHRLGSKVFRVLRESDGLQGDEYTFKCVMNTDDGRLMFGGKNGMTIFHPRDMSINTTPPPMVISAYTINGEFQSRSLVNNDTLLLDYTRNVLSFEFAALNFLNPEVNRYEHYMENLEGAWIHDEYRRYASYANLQPGSYRFRVRGSNSDDIWNEQGMAVTIIITPPWWGTWWAKTIAVLGSLGLILGSVLLYVRIQTRRSQQRQAVVSSQMQALRAQMNPHFMFNALNSVQRLILQSDVNGAVQALSKFARLVRMTLESTIHPIHSLEEEVEWLRLYLELEKLRYNEKLNFSISVDERLDRKGINVPTMLIQPFIENAIRHGIFHKQSPGYLSIEFMRRESGSNTAMVCSITDDGVGRERARELTRQLNLPTTSVGINSTTERLNLINEQRKTQEHITMSFEDLKHPDGSAAGTKVVLVFPFTEEEI